MTGLRQRSSRRGFAPMKRWIFLYLLALVLSLPDSVLAASLGRLAYIRDGDLWVKALPEGPALRLTTSGDASHPRWSFSGKWLCFQTESGLWLTEVSDANPLTLHQAARFDQVRWSPVSDQLAYVVAGELWIKDAEAGPPRPLVRKTSPEDRVREIAWSPDGKSILYQFEQKRAAVKGEWPWDYSLWMISTRTGEQQEVHRFPRPLLGRPEDEGFMPGEPILAGWADMGALPLFWQGELVSASLLADGAPLYALPPDGRPQRLGLTLLYKDFLALSPDTKYLAITDGSGRDTAIGKAIALVDLASGRARLLTDAGTAACSAAWSPAGEHLAYVAAPAPESETTQEEIDKRITERRIWVMAKDGGQQRPLTRDQALREERPQWSADGRYILFARLDTFHKASMWLAPVVANAEPQEVVAGLYLDEQVRLNAYYNHIDWDALFAWHPDPPPGLSPFSFFWRVAAGAAATLLAALFAFLWRIRRQRDRAAAPDPANPNHAAASRLKS